MIEELRRGAAECEARGVNGWGNTMADAANEIERLRAQIHKHFEICPLMSRGLIKRANKRPEIE